MRTPTSPPTLTPQIVPSVTRHDRELAELVHGLLTTPIVERLSISEALERASALAAERGIAIPEQNAAAGAKVHAAVEPAVASSVAAAGPAVRTTFVYRTDGGVVKDVWDVCGGPVLGVLQV